VQAERNWALVLALIEGPTFADRIQQGAIPPDEAIALTKQVPGSWSRDGKAL
jgi:hypothetical protein